jgi:hypothetical protein
MGKAAGIAGVVMGLAISGAAAGTTRNAASCAWADVNAAVGASSYGDTVQVPACGATTWSNTLAISKGISLRGAGSGSTLIYSGVAAGKFLIVYTPDATSVASDTPFEVSGFTFDFNNNNSGGVWVDNRSPTKPITKVTLHDNVFRNLVSNGTSTDVACVRIGENGDAWGVAYLNTFTNCKVVANNYGGFENSWNNTTFAFGSQNSFYWEDNTFNGNSAFHYGGHGGRYVARFNTYHFTSGTYEVLWDVHGNQPSGVYGTMGCEIYRNNVVLDRSTTIIDHRGGSCMFFQNTFTGTNGSWQVREEYADSIDPTSNPQPQHVSNSYYFLNLLNGANQRVSELSDCCGAIAENAQYWNYVSPFTGAQGVGAGALASRPSTCTTGVGYWATDQGSWNTAGGASGLFYRCSAPNTWTLYYTPLAYPHPLRGAPLPTPANLRVS